MHCVIRTRNILLQPVRCCGWSTLRVQLQRKPHPHSDPVQPRPCRATSKDKRPHYRRLWTCRNNSVFLLALKEEAGIGAKFKGPGVDDTVLIGLCLWEMQDSTT